MDLLSYFWLIWKISTLQGHLYIIDVSQSVDLDHPHALDFLREDCVHVSVCFSSFCFHMHLTPFLNRKKLCF